MSDPLEVNGAYTSQCFFCSTCYTDSSKKARARRPLLNPVLCLDDLCSLLSDEIGPRTCKYIVFYLYNKQSMCRFYLDPVVADYSLHNVKVSGESASADVKAAAEFLESLDKPNVENNYLPEQIFNMDETSLF